MILTSGFPIELAMNLRESIYDRGVGTYLALIFSAISILLTLVLVEIIGVSATAQIKSNIGNSLAELALQTSDKLDRGMFERYREVRLLAQRRDLIASGTPIDDKRRILDERQETFAYYAWIGMTDMHGKVVVATHKMLEGSDVSHRPWFSNALQGNFLGDVHEAVLLAKLLPALDNEPKRFVDVAFPYSDRDGKLLGVLGAHLSWQWAKEVERSIMLPISARLGAESVIVNSNGTVLLGPASLQGRDINPGSFKAAQERRNGYAVEEWEDGRHYLVGYSKSVGYANYPGLGWTVLVRQSLDDAYQPVRRIQRQVLWSGIALALLFSLLGVFAARRIARPLRELAESASRIRTGEALQIAPHDDSYREVRTLGESLNALVANLLQKESDLRDLNLTLENRVAQRTRELEQALAVVSANEKRIQTIIEAAQDAYIGVDLRGDITDWNSAAEKMFGWSSKEAIGRPLAQLVIPERFRASFERAISVFNQTGRTGLLNQRVERLVVNRTGQEFPVEVTVGLAGGRDTYFFSTFLHDISERKKVEQMKNEFISTVSHELRTPLTSIRASLGLLVGGVGEELPADTRALVEIANRSCERLVRLVNDVLDIEKIESGKIDFDLRKQALRPLIQEALEGIESYAQQYKVTLAPDLSCIPADFALTVDHDRLIQVLHNLLSNAIKFSPPGGTVRLHVACDEHEVRLSVEDSGRGIPAAFRERMFQKFAQADSTDSRQKGGTGLGLSICKSIVEEHGGMIRFDSEEGRGTVFHVTLPVEPVTAVKAGG